MRPSNSLEDVGCHTQDSLAEWSKALAQGASPQGRGFEPHSCHYCSSFSLYVELLHRLAGWLARHYASSRPSELQKRGTQALGSRTKRLGAKRQPINVIDAQCWRPNSVGCARTAVAADGSPSGCALTTPLHLILDCSPRHPRHTHNTPSRWARVSQPMELWQLGARRK